MSNDDTYRIECPCGYVLGGLTSDRAERFAGQHSDDDHEALVVTGGAA